MTGFLEKWEKLKTLVVQHCEYDVDKWDLKYSLNAFKVTKDENQIILKGEKFDIECLKRHNFELFQSGFEILFPDFELQFEEINNKEKK